MANRRSLALRRNDASAPLRPGTGMASPTEDFERANGPLGSNWVTHTFPDDTPTGTFNAFDINSGAAVVHMIAQGGGVASRITSSARWVAAQGPDQAIEVDVQNVVGNNGYITLHTHASGANHACRTLEFNFYDDGEGGGEINVVSYRVAASGSWTQLAEVTLPYPAEPIRLGIGADAAGAGRAYVNGSQVMTWTDSSPATGQYVAFSAMVLNYLGSPYTSPRILAVTIGGSGGAGGASLYDSALRADFSYIPEDLDPPEAILHVRDISHTVIEVAFDPLSIPTDPNFGAPKEISLVRSPSGFPATLLDGAMVRRHPPLPPDNDGWVRILDSGLTPSTWYYYGLFAKYESEGNTHWLRIGEKSALLPNEYLSAEHLWERIPEWYRRADLEPGGQDGVLRRMIDVIGYQTDAHRTWAHTVGDVWDAEKISADLLPWLGDTLGQPVEYAAGDERYRALLSNILPLRKMKGTEHGTEAYISAITGYRTRVYSGLNLLPTTDEAEAKYSSGLWAVGGAVGVNATLTRVVSTGAATPGPASGRTYHRLTFNTAVSQQPWLLLGASGNMSQKISFPANHEIVTSAFFRSSLSGTLTVDYKWYTAAGAVIGSNVSAIIGAIGTGWVRAKTVPVTTPPGTAFVEIKIMLMTPTAVAGLVVEVTEIQVVDLAWRPEDTPGSINVPPLSWAGTPTGEYSDAGYYEPPRTVHVNVYPQRINYALNSDFALDNLPVDAWTVAERTTWGLLKQAYSDWGDIHDAQVGDSEADWGDLAEGFAPLSGDWSITFETANRRMRLNPSGAPNYVAQVQSDFVPVVEGDSISAAFVSWATVPGVKIILSVQFFTAEGLEYALSIDGVNQDVHGAQQTMSASPYRYELRNAVIPPGAAFARVVVETRHTETYSAYLQKALIENAQVPGTYFNGDEVDSAYGDYFYIGLPHESYSVYYQNYRSFINDAGGSDRITSLMDELLPMESDFVLRTAAYGLY